MALDPITAVLDIGGKLLDRFVPDPAAKLAAQAELLKFAHSADLAQTEVNKAEAAHASIFVSGWRPFIGWVCGWACAWNWIGLPVVKTMTVIMGYNLVLAPADLEQMMPVLLGMLGMGGLRTFEKVKKVAAK